MSKILIWNTFPIKNTGGPSGYNYNIWKYLQDYPTDEITFLSDLLGGKLLNTNPKIRLINNPKNFLARVYNALKYRVGLLYNFIYGSYKDPFDGIPDDFDANDYDYIHVHFSMHAGRIKRTFPNFKGKVIVTSHQPCSTVSEVLDTTTYPFLKLFRHLAQRCEAKSYDVADYIMFPCKQAREPYEKVPVLRKSFRRNDSKFFYVPSAILDLNIDDKKMQRFSDFGIPQDAFVVTYFGRHNLIKGYDILKIVGTALLDKYPKLYFLCAGIGDLQPVNHPGWIELGFINNAHELLYQSNLYILPNRETFFDLITLEILRSSTPIILSETGGNRYFKEELPKEEIEGFDFFNVNNIDDLISKVEAHINEYYNNRDKYEQKAIANRSLYLKRFTVESFVKSYLSKINSLR